MTLEQIYERHADFVWRTLRRLGVTEADARDATHDVFLLVHGHLARFEGRSSLTTWLFTLCRTVARDFRRRKRLEPELREDDLDELDLRADVGRAVEHRQELAELERILSTLPAAQRNVFILFEIEKMTGEELSEALRIPLGTVYSRLTLARKAFRARVSREYTVPSGMRSASLSSSPVIFSISNKMKTLRCAAGSVLKMRSSSASS